MSSYGSKLDPYRKLRESRGVKGIRQSVVITNNPSTIDQNQQLFIIVTFTCGDALQSG